MPGSKVQFPVRFDVPLLEEIKGHQAKLRRVDRVSVSLAEAIRSLLRISLDDYFSIWRFDHE